MAEVNLKRRRIGATGYNKRETANMEPRDRRFKKILERIKKDPEGEGLKAEENTTSPLKGLDVYPVPLKQITSSKLTYLVELCHRFQMEYWIDNDKDNHIRFRIY